jgi:hypothetical protein
VKQRIGNGELMMNDSYWSTTTGTVNGCFCVGPQEGEPLCPCRMREEKRDLKASESEWKRRYEELLERNKEIGLYENASGCLHNNCSDCNGTGQRKDGLGHCIHMISCPCPKCSPRC